MTGHLPSSLARFLGVDLPATGDAATWQLDATWRWPPWATLLLVLVAIVWTITLYTREGTEALRNEILRNVPLNRLERQDVERTRKLVGEMARRLREDPAAIEEQARRELGLIKPGEVLFIVNDISRK